MRPVFLAFNPVVPAGMGLTATQTCTGSWPADRSAVGAVDVDDQGRRRHQGEHDRDEDGQNSALHSGASLAASRTQRGRRAARFAWTPVPCPPATDDGLGRNGMTRSIGKSKVTVKVPPTTFSVTKLQLLIEPTPARSRTSSQNGAPPTSSKSSMPTTARRAASRAALVAWMRVLNAVPNWMKPNRSRTSRGRSSANSTAAAPSSPLLQPSAPRLGRRCTDVGLRAAGEAVADVPVPVLDRC